MARLNIDDDIESKKEFWTLFKLVGDRDVALGKLIRFFRMAQKAHGHGLALTADELREEELGVMIESKWAVPVEGGYTCKGASKHFAWYAQRVQAGKSRASANRDVNGRFQKDTPILDQRITSEEPAEHQRDSSELPATHQPLSLAPSLALSLSLVPVQKKKEEEKKASASSEAPQDEFGESPRVKSALTNPDGPSDTALTWRAYKQAYAKRWGHEPPWNAKTGGQLRSFTTRIPSTEAPEVAAFYLTHSDRQYVQAMHPVWLLLKDAEKLRTEWVTGRKITTSQAQHVERAQHNSDVFARAAERLNRLKGEREGG